MQLFKNSLLLIASSIVLFACNNKQQKKHTDTPSSGTIDISVDETYKPIIKQQLQVFDSSFPDANINVEYKSEVECLKDFFEDSATRLILVTRELSKQEKETLEQNKVVTRSLSIAKDAVAIITNKDNPDSTFSISQIKGILTGEHVKNYNVVFDNQGSSTLRYMLDSIITGEKLGENVFALNGNDSVIQYVSTHKNAIGLVGVSHVSDFSDPEGLAFISSIRVASILNDSLDKYYKPYQIYIASEYYPFVRHLYYIHKETHQGLAHGFSKFLREYRGQLIFKSARLFPTRVNTIFRDAEINN